MKKPLLLAWAFMLISLIAKGTTFVITVQNFMFTPSSLAINLGDTVTWQWLDGSHTTSSLTIPAGAPAWSAPMNVSAPTFTYVPVVTGTYNYQCIPHGAFGMVGSFTVACSAVTPSVNASGPLTFCAGSSVSLTSDGASAYLWSSGQTTQSISVNASGSYIVTVTDVSGCTAQSAPAVVTVNPLPAATVTPAGPTTFCMGGSVVLDANTASGLTYKWRKGTAVISGATLQSYTAATGGNYNVIVTNSNGCSKISSPNVMVTVNALPTATITPNGPITFCKGPTPLTLTANSGTGFTYKWKKGSAYVSGAVAQTYQPVATATYKVEVTNANGCSKLSAGIAVTVNAIPAAMITPQGLTTFCNGDSVVLQANAGAGLTYQWLKGVNNISGATSQNFTAKQAATYKVIVTNSSNCSKTSAGVKITINCKAGDDMQEMNVMIYPNPATTSAEIQFEGFAEGKGQIAVYDLVGQQVLKQDIAIVTGNNNHKLDLATLAKGAYTVRVTYNGLARNCKLIVQ